MDTAHYMPLEFLQKMYLIRLLAYFIRGIEILEHFCITHCWIGRVYTVKALVIYAFVIIAKQRNVLIHKTRFNTFVRITPSNSSRELTSTINQMKTKNI
jgi:hypothetical protein